MYTSFTVRVKLCKVIGNRDLHLNINEKLIYIKFHKGSALKTFLPRLIRSRRACLSIEIWKIDINGRSKHFVGSQWLDRPSDLVAVEF